MTDGRIAREVYSAWLGEMHHLHTALEAALTDCPLAANLFAPAEMSRTG